MNKIQIEQRLSELINPVDIPIVDFSDEILSAKCKLWDDVHGKDRVKVYNTIGRTIKPTERYIIENVISGDIWSPVCKQAGIVAVESTLLSVKGTKYEALWSSLLDSVSSSVKYVIMNLVYIHIYTKFTTAEFRSLQQAMSNNLLQDQMELHEKIKALDWFWNNGFYCLRTVNKNEYNVYSFHDFSHTRTVTI